MKAMAIAGPFQNLAKHFKTNDVLSGAKRTRARSSALSRQVRAGRAFEMSWNQSGGDPSANALISSVSSTQFERDSAVDGSFSVDLSRAGQWRSTSRSSTECE